ncbi:MAG: hypothetical protein HYY04_13300 [Chloroflexi bacterium]|nr:hypothetical protein [Chloroflexota bacterium]
MGAPFYEAAALDGRIGRGDVAFLYLPQTRVVGEVAPPLAAPSRRTNVPAYAGAFSLLDPAQMPTAEVRVWPALAVVVMDSCELDRFFNQGRDSRQWDSRVAVAPIIFESQYPHGPWDRMAEGRAPLYAFSLEPLPPGIVGEAHWPRAFVDLRGTTLVSRQHVQPNRKLRLGREAADALAYRVLEFWYLREVARHRDLDARRGQRIADIVPVQAGADYVEVRVTFEDADPLRLICRTDR